MVTKYIKNYHLEYWFLAFAFLHLFIWTLIPVLIRLNLPMDALEGTIWGQQLEWGYDKNPFMNAWLTSAAIWLGGYTGWMTYLFSQLSVVICFWAVWQLGKKIISPLYALIAVLLLECIQYYNIHAIDFNDNVLELSLWALTILFFYQALQQNKLRDWICTGLFAGLGMMTKYYTAMLLIPMLCFLFLNKMARVHWKKVPIYCGGLIFILLILPHFIWLITHHWVTLNYALNRTMSNPHWFNHFFYPLKFTWQQVIVFLPSFLILLFFKKDRVPLSSITAFDKEFLIYLGLGPFLLTIFISALAGFQLHAGWGTPLLSLWGILCIIWLRPNVTPKKFFVFLFIIFSILLLIAAGYSFALLRAPAPSSANYPGEAIAKSLTENWHNQYHTSLKYIAGSRWLSGNVALYSKDHPHVYIDWNKDESPWIDESNLQREGGIFVWDLSEQNKNVPEEEVMKRFHHLGKITTWKFAWLRNKDLPPIEIRVAVLPPVV